VTWQPPPTPAASVPQIRSGRAPWSFLDLLGVLGLGIAFAIVLLIVGLIGVRLATGEQIDQLSGPAQFALVATEIYGGFGLATWLLIVRRKRLAWGTLGFRPAPVRTILAMIPAGVVLLFVNLLLLTPLTYFFGLGDPDAGKSQEEVFSPEGGLHALDYLWLIVPLVILAPLVEELAFRGLLYGYLRGRTNIAISVIVSALVFAVLHVVIPPLFVMGVVLALIAQRTKSLLPGIALHATNTLLVVIFLAIANAAD
jgi:uncharacterized protein